MDFYGHAEKDSPRKIPRSYSERLATFVGWPLRYPTPKKTQPFGFLLYRHRGQSPMFSVRTRLRPMGNPRRPVAGTSKVFAALYVSVGRSVSNDIGTKNEKKRERDVKYEFRNS